MTEFTRSGHSRSLKSICHKVSDRREAAIGVENGYLDIVTEDEGFVLFACEYEHWFRHPWF